MWPAANNKYMVTLYWGHIVYKVPWAITIYSTILPLQLQADLDDYNEVEVAIWLHETQTVKRSDNWDKSL